MSPATARQISACAILVSLGGCDSGRAAAGSAESHGTATPLPSTTTGEASSSSEAQEMPTSMGGEASTSDEEVTTTATTTTGPDPTGGPSDGSSSTGNDLERPDPDALIGWAAAEGSGLRGTTGGAGGPVVTVDTIEELRMFGEQDAPHVILIDGALEGDVALGSNTTLRGLAGASLHGEIRIVGPADGPQRENIIISDLVLRGDACEGGCDDRDVITIRRAHHVWVDHCDIADGDDGNLDITVESDFITVSWCRFSYISDDRVHRYSNLIGASDDAVEDADDLGVTLHHNWWAENVAERMPRARFGKIHVFNNYYSSAQSNYCVRAATDANLRIENNHFDGVPQPIDPDLHEGALVTATGNLSSEGGLFNTMQGDAFTPPYPYTLDDVTSVRARVTAEAGPR